MQFGGLRMILIRFHLIWKGVVGVLGFLLALDYPGLGLDKDLGWLQRDGQPIKATQPWKIIDNLIKIYPRLTKATLNKVS